MSEIKLITIEVAEGCYGTSVLVDGIHWEKLDSKFQEQLIGQVISKMKEDEDSKNIIINLLTHLIPEHSEYDDEPCEQCGTYFQSETYEV